MLALEPRMAPLLAKRQPIPARLTRLTLYPVTWLLHEIKTAPEPNCWNAAGPRPVPIPPPPAKRRPGAPPPPRGRGEEKKTGGEG